MYTPSFCRVRLWVTCIIFASGMQLEAGLKRQVHASGVVLKTMLKPKKKIIIFSCNGGGGHRSASNALQAYLGDEYTIKVVNILSDVLRHLDPVRKLTLRRYNGEDVYNYFLQHRWVMMTNLLCRYGRMRVRSQHRAMERILSRYVADENPDMLISVMPLVNSPILSVARRAKIPFLVVTTDLDTSNYVVGVKSPHYEKFKYSLAFNDHSMHEKISQARLADNQVEVRGFPLRPDFFEKKSPERIRSEFGIPQNKKTAMILMGATGSSSTYRYVKSLARVSYPLHLVVCLGRNKKLGKQIERIAFNENVTYTLVGFTDRISDLMSASDVLITKSGPNSVCEALALNVPILVDNTTRPLFWERLNLDFVRKHHFGELISRHQDTPALLHKYFTDNTYYQTIKKNLESFKKVNFKTSIRSLVRRMLKQTV